MTRLAHLAIIPAALFATTASSQGDFSGVEVTAQEIAPGIAVLFGAGGNIGVSYGDEATLIIDDQFAPLSAKIEAAIADLDAKPVKYVVNTHWHFDHTGGNEHFGKTGATIFAHQDVRVRMAEGNPDGPGGRNIPPAPRVALPIVTYDQGLRIHLNGDTINVMFLGGGHTDGDSVIFWEEDNVVHMGDLYFKISGYPFIDVKSGGNVYDAMRSLDLVIARIDSDTKVIPGHGSMSNKAELTAYRAMIGEVVRRVEELRGQGLTLEEALATKPLADIDRGEGGFIGPDAFVTAVWDSAR
ncbi:Zn-dependent hydrolase [Erythrobacter longus]|uniref:Zn-dependent hydrolase n=1 Tax=Erythrobacter longus TaxID=1044 RepID=A0A074MD85_ERYLO|nr:MBL fold metallo-hydrolase [Erythrobacter longus]KEO91429.1 Zn-dependent hydrolase [Erythrobacter longus]